MEGKTRALATTIAAILSTSTVIASTSDHFSQDTVVLSGEAAKLSLFSSDFPGTDPALLTINTTGSVESVTIDNDYTIMVQTHEESLDNTPIQVTIQDPNSGYEIQSQPIHVIQKRTNSIGEGIYSALCEVYDNDEGSVGELHFSFDSDTTDSIKSQNSFGAIDQIVQTDGLLTSLDGSMNLDGHTIEFSDLLNIGTQHNTYWFDAVNTGSTATSSQGDISIQPLTWSSNSSNNTFDWDFKETAWPPMAKGTWSYQSDVAQGDGTFDCMFYQGEGYTDSALRSDDILDSLPSIPEFTPRPPPPTKDVPTEVARMLKVLERTEMCSEDRERIKARLMTVKTQKDLKGIPNEIRLAHKNGRLDCSTPAPSDPNTLPGAGVTAEVARILNVLEHTKMCNEDRERIEARLKTARVWNDLKGIRHTIHLAGEEGVANCVQVPPPDDTPSPGSGEAKVTAEIARILTVLENTEMCQKDRDRILARLASVKIWNDFKGIRNEIHLANKKGMLNCELNPPSPG
jgi:hypothetical protein